MSDAMSTSGESTQYVIDAAGVITSVAGAWSAFAAAGGAPELSPERVVGQPWSSFVTDAATCQLYQILFQRVRQGNRVTVPFRCDAPGLRRHMELTLEPIERGAIRCEATLLSEEPRIPVSLLRMDVRRSSALVRMCGWCKRVPVEGRWLEVEEAVDRLGLFYAPALPNISHGICPDCKAEVLQAIPGSTEPEEPV